MTHTEKSYPDLRQRLRSALGSLIPSGAIYPLPVVLEVFDEYLSTGPERGPQETEVLHKLLDAVLAYRVAYRERAALPEKSSDPPIPSPTDLSRWALFCQGWQAMPGLLGPTPPMPPAEVPESQWGKWARMWVVAGRPTDFDLAEWQSGILRSGILSDA